ncbi:hypothetical protein SAMN04515647_3801 [Cohaesibacter sp. ES.047]|uniref:hypothetical protein n=1 Tax=Cohaesibacter sp. ES.047 TaxID=1798205 RepID=UPI000BB7993F|nr:hypothetical protein [Cohaesibacter sp. ES.047]SNY93504.1 hypothetical protein SAMN04515647_3801 [Cohaesibacter sp. ES.047]
MMLVSGIGAMLGGTGTAAAAAGAATAGAGAATAATTAATASTGLFGSGISAGTILKGVAGFASAVAGMTGANAQAEQFEMQADQSEMQATDEEAKGLQRTTDIKRQLMKSLGENAVKFAASGQLVGEGVSEDMELALEDRAAQDITVDRADTDARKAMLRARAAGWRRVAGRTKSAGGLSALAGFAGAFG